MHIFNGLDALLVGAVVVLSFCAHYCFKRAEQARRRLRRYPVGDLTRVAQEIRRERQRRLVPLNRDAARDDMSSVA